MLSKRHINIIWPLAAILSLAACAKPQTIGPVATKAEIAAEGRAQEEFVRQTSQTKATPISANSDIAPRVRETAQKIIPAAANLCKDLGAENPTPMYLRYPRHRT